MVIDSKSNLMNTIEIENFTAEDSISENIIYNSFVQLKFNR